jgi:protein-S-isoprenylcysteine O-methyltransferase Ste14
MADGEAPKRYNRTLGILRIVAVFAALGGLVVVSRPTVMTVAIGATVVVLGELVRLWAAGHLRKTVELVTSGPYRYTRNPLYLGRLIILTGVFIMARLPYQLNLVALLAAYFVFFAYYLPRKERVESARLRELHGEPYERYHDEVPALIPSVQPYRQGSSAGWSSDRMLRNREHWMVIGLVGLTLLMLARAHGVIP